MRTTIYLLIIVLVAISCHQGKAQKTEPAKLEFQTYSDWEAKYDENSLDEECWELTIPDFLKENSAVTVQLRAYEEENDQPNSTIALIDKEGNYLATLFEPTQFHQFALEYATLSVGDVDGNGLKDIKIDFPYMGNGLMACAIRAIYIFQAGAKTFNKISFDSFVCRDHVAETDVDGDGKWEIIVRTLEYIDENNHYWVDNIYKYTPEGLICVSKENGYPKALNVSERKSTDAKIVARHKEEWTVEQPKGYLFLKSSR